MVNRALDRMNPAATTGTAVPAAQGLYNPRNEHDACGVGFIVNMKGVKSHDIVRDGLSILENLTHRGAVGADPLMGDGAGMLTQIPDRLFREEMAAQGVELPTRRPLCRGPSVPAPGHGECRRISRRSSARSPMPRA